MRRTGDLGRLPRNHIHHLVLKVRVRHRDDEAFVWEWPAGEDSLANGSVSDLLGRLGGVRVGDVYDNRLVLA